MKLLSTLMAIALIATSAIAQDGPLAKLIELETNDTIKTAKQDTTLKVKEKEADITLPGKDTTKIRFGKKEIIIIEKDGSTSIEIPDSDEKFSIDSKKNKNFTYKRKPRFRGNWAGFEWGFNGFMDANYSNNLQGDLRYLELKQGQSWNFNLNILQYSLGFGTDKVGLVTGLGFEFNNYIFRNESTLRVINGVTVEDNAISLDPNKTVTKSKFDINYMTLPLLLEFQIPTINRHRLFLSAGVVGGVKLSSQTKIEYEGLTKGKERIKDDFNLSAFRYGLTARVGFRALSVFATYYPVQLFEENKGPEVYPFAIGLRLINFGGS
jgi:hypothetical protein